ncbi:MAG: glycosyltransferase [Fimbriiglobus sp.]
MDLFAEMIRKHATSYANLLEPIPPYRRMLSGRVKGGVNFDRMWNRYRLYPQAIRNLSAHAFVIPDHSYAHLVHSLPAEKTAVICHDINAFRSLLEPEKEPRPWWFRRLMKPILTGLTKARWVFADSEDTKAELLRFSLVPQERIQVVFPAAAPEFCSLEGHMSLPWIEALNGTPWLLHVGSCVSRKRIEVLLEVFSRLRQSRPTLKLVKIGGDFSNDHNQIIDRNGLRQSLIHRSGLSRLELAEVYRRASVVLMTSDHEGFGLPVLEASACGAPVVASDLPIFREVGKSAIRYAPVGDIEAWTQVVSEVLSGNSPPKEARFALAAGHTWDDYTRIVFSKLLAS